FRSRRGARRCLTHRRHEARVGTHGRRAMTRVIFLVIILFASPIHAGDWVNLPVEEWRISRDAPPWLRQAALRSSILWCRADKSLCRPFKTVPDPLANIVIGYTPPEFIGMALLSPDFRPLVVISETDV